MTTRRRRLRRPFNVDLLPRTGATHARNIPCTRCWRQSPNLMVHINFGVCVNCAPHLSMSS